MLIVIIAGGSGTRLWPLSTPSKPKQLLSLTGERTMVQQAYGRATELGDNIYVVTEASHAGSLRRQLPELPDSAFLIEPGRRGTANCILFALDYITRNHNSDEPIAFIHADHNVRDIKGFAGSFKQAAAVSVSRQVITLIGIEPTFPSTGFGYIERGEPIKGGAYSVISFREKPDYDTAVKYLETGNYLWNCGYFVGSVDVFISQIRQFAPSLIQSYNRLQAISEFASDYYNQLYLELENQVIDIALIEKTPNLAMIPASFDWMDIGNFKDLHNVVSKDRRGNYCRGENIHTIDVENTYIRNECADKPVAVIGLDNIVVVNTPDGILVARKDVAEKCGDIAKQL